MHLMTGKKKLEDEYKNCKMLPKINKSVMAGTMEAIEEYLRSCHSDVQHDKEDHSSADLQ